MVIGGLWNSGNAPWGSPSRRPAFTGSPTPLPRCGRGLNGVTPCEGPPSRRRSGSRAAETPQVFGASGYKQGNARQLRQGIAGKNDRRVVPAFVGTALAQGRRRQCKGPVAPGRRPAHAEPPQARSTHGPSRPRRLGLHDLLQGAPPEVYSTNPLELFHAEIKRRANVVGPILLKKNDE